MTEENEAIQTPEIAAECSIGPEMGTAADGRRTSPAAAELCELKLNRGNRGSRLRHPRRLRDTHPVGAGLLLGLARSASLRPHRRDPERPSLG
jgi:hypothetical protein